MVSICKRSWAVDSEPLNSSGFSSRADLRGLSFHPHKEVTGAIIVKLKLTTIIKLRVNSSQLVNHFPTIT